MVRLHKAVFPVADCGTAFLPATKATPKEMLAVVDKPLIQLAVEEAAAAGIDQMIFVTGRHQRAIEDHFDKAYELENVLADRGDAESLARLHGLPRQVSYLHVRQPAMRGVVDALLCARALLEDEPFAVILADELIDAATPVLKQMLDAFERTGASIVAVQDSDSHTDSDHGFVLAEARVRRVHRVVARRCDGAARLARLAIAGRLIVTPSALRHIVRAAEQASGEPMKLSQALERVLEHEPLLACEFEGTRYDCSSPLGYLKAVIAHALRHAEVGTELRDYVASLLEAPRLAETARAATAMAGTGTTATTAASREDAVIAGRAPRVLAAPARPPA